MTQPPAGRLLLDEMFSPVIAAALRDLGHDVAAMAEQPALRAMTDEEVFAFPAARGQWLLTENVKDFQPIVQQALQAGTPAAGLLFTSTRAFPRSRKNPGPLIHAIDAWLTTGTPLPPLTEDWLIDPDTSPTPLTPAPDAAGPPRSPRRSAGGVRPGR